MKNSKSGISMSALIIYIISLVVIIGIIVVFNINILSSANNLVKSSKLYEQYMMFNMFFTQSISNANYANVSIDGNVLELYNSEDQLIGKYIYNSQENLIEYQNQDETINFVVTKYLNNDNIFSVSSVNGKQIIEVSIDYIIGTIEYNPLYDVRYVIGG